MTLAPESRRTLPLVEVGPGLRHGSRSYATCHFRCANACDHPEPNTSENNHIRDEVGHALKRRTLFTGAAGLGAVVATGLALDPRAAAAAESAPTVARGGAARVAGTDDLAKVEFKPVAPNKRDAVVVADGFDYDVIMRWGDPVLADAPEFDVYSQTPEAAAKQFGYNNDYVGVLPLGKSATEALLVCNHEYTNENMMYPTGKYTSAQIKQLSMAYHGMSVVQITRGLVPGSWAQSSDLSKAVYNRRITATTPFQLTGPAVGDERLKTKQDKFGAIVKGTFANCAGGLTPWGTVLSGEENFNGYFDKSGSLDSRYTAQYARYGITGSGSRGWSEIDSRFDLSIEPHEVHRFGWIVEVDPLKPNEAPKKHTMLGRFKHEGANVVIAKDKRVVVYMGDDERGDYMYKFVSAGTFDPANTAKARAKNKLLLDKGTLYVAKFTGNGTADSKYDGTGQWIPLTSDTQSFVDGMSVNDVLIFTRLAADKVGPTKMDRPEDVDINPVNGKVYAALTNNSNRGNATTPVDEANPLSTSMVRSALGQPLTSASGNRNGYILELTADGDDHTATTFGWDLMLVCGDPSAPETYFAGFDKSKVSPISCPDNVAFDSLGNLWIATDGNVLGSNDGLFRVAVEGANRGQVQQFVTMPKNAETCGPFITDNNRSLFFAVQHPGESDTATFETPTSTWPHSDDFPRPAVCVAFRKR